MLRIDGYELREVLFPDEKGRAQEGVAIVVAGGPFPGRAVLARMFVGDEEAELVETLDGGARIRGILRERPSPGDELLVTYGDEMQGRARLERFEVRPLPKGC
jgi:hypothetical protein